LHPCCLVKESKKVYRAPWLNDNKIDYVYWDELPMSSWIASDYSWKADHNAHDNEILSIIEEFHEAGQ